MPSLLNHKIFLAYVGTTGHIAHENPMKKNVQPEIFIGWPPPNGILFLIGQINEKLPLKTL